MDAFSRLLFNMLTNSYRSYTIICTVHKSSEMAGVGRLGEIDGRYEKEGFRCQVLGFGFRGVEVLYPET
jgi:hypothetical protein